MPLPTSKLTGKSSSAHQHHTSTRASWEHAGSHRDPFSSLESSGPLTLGRLNTHPASIGFKGASLKLLHELGVLFRTLSDGTAPGQSYRGDRPLDGLPRNHLHRWKGDKSNLVGAHPAPLPHSASHSGKASAFSLKSYIPGTRREGVLPLHYLAVTAAT